MAQRTLTKIARVLVESQIHTATFVRRASKDTKIPQHILPESLQNKDSEKMQPSFSSRLKKDNQVAKERKQWWPETPSVTPGKWNNPAKECLEEESIENEDLMAEFAT